MTKQEAIKYLQELYPNGGNCWLDEQRIEAIGMAIKALQEEPVSNPIDFEKELYKAFGHVKDFTLGMRIAKWFYDMGKKSEPVSEDLKAAIECCRGNNGSDARVRTGFIMGAKWQKEHLWKPADGDDLPEIDREVIVLTQHYPLEGSEYAVYFAHRPNPDGWDGKSLTTGEVEHYIPKTYDKGGWNIPDVKYWLDVELPKEIEL